MVNVVVAHKRREILLGVVLFIYFLSLYEILFIIVVVFDVYCLFIFFIYYLFSFVPYLFHILKACLSYLHKNFENTNIYKYFTHL